MELWLNRFEDYLEEKRITLKERKKKSIYAGSSGSRQELPWDLNSSHLAPGVYGLSQATLFKYFKTKDDLLTAWPTSCKSQAFR